MDPLQSAGAASASLGRLGLHDHACLFRDAGPERLDVASAFLRNGLARGERCLYTAGENSAGRIMPHLRMAGIDVGGALASGDLEIATDGEVLPFGLGDVGAAFARLEERIEAALSAGYKGLRVLGEATWALARTPRLEKLDELEERLKRLFQDRPVVGIWRYDPTRCSPGLLRCFLRMHPFVAVGDEVLRNVLFVPPGSEAGPAGELRRAIDFVLERARADEALARQWEQLRLALDGGAHALWTWEAEGDRVTIDPRWADMPGIDPARMTLTVSEWEQVIHPDELAPMWRSAREHVEGGSERLEHECRMRARSGSWRWVHLRGKAIERDAAGRGTRIAGTATDVTAVREARDRRVTDDELAAAGRFTSRVAHEINNPLAWITTNVGFVKELLERSVHSGAPIPTGDLSRVLEAMRETEEGAARIRGVLDALPRPFGALENGKPTARDVRPEILAAVREARDAVAARARLSVSLPERLPRVVAHEGALGKVFLSLLLHAARAIPEGSPEENEIRVAAHVRGGGVVVEVTDSGVGMSPIVREHMFDLFLASEADPSPEFSAGLFLSRAIVERSGGHVEVESEPARGTTVRVVLPACGEDTAR